MGIRTTARGARRAIAAAAVLLGIGVTATSCFGAGEDGSGALGSASCQQLRAALTGSWQAADGSTSTGWRFPGRFTLGGNGVFTSGGTQLAWGVAFSPAPEGSEVCDGLMLIDATELPVITYDVQISGDLLVITNWSRSELYYRVGGASPQFQIDALEFADDRPIERDGGAVFSGPEWLRGGEAQPLLYPRGSTVAVQVSGTVTGSSGGAPLPVAGTLRGTTLDGITFTGDLQVSGGSFSVAASSTSLPDYVKQIALDVDWTVDIAGQVLPAGTTQNVLYCTLDEPLELPVSETLALIACRDGYLATDRESALDHVWTFAFADTTTKLFDAHGRYFTYYDPAPTGVPQQLCTTLSGMLPGPNAAPYIVGQCTAWAELMQAVLAVHGIDSTVYRIGALDAQNNLLELLVRCWRWCPDGNQTGFVYQTATAVHGSCGSSCGSGTSYRAENEAGVRGQMNPEPPGGFELHAVLEVDPALDDGVFDPSYGTYSATRLDHERDAIVGVANQQHLAQRLDPNRTQLRTVWAAQGTAAATQPAAAGWAAVASRPIAVSPDGWLAGWAPLVGAGRGAAALACLVDHDRTTSLVVSAGPPGAWTKGDRLHGWPVSMFVPGPLNAHAVTLPNGSFLLACDPVAGARAVLQLVEWSPNAGPARTRRVSELRVGSALAPRVVDDLSSPHLLRHDGRTLVFAAAARPDDGAPRSYVGELPAASGAVDAIEIGPGVDPCAVALGARLVCATRELRPGALLSESAPLRVRTAPSAAGPWQPVMLVPRGAFAAIDLARTSGGSLLLAGIRAEPGLPPTVELFAADRPEGPWVPLMTSLRVPDSRVGVAHAAVRAGNVAFAVDATGAARELIVSNPEGTDLVRMVVPGR